MMEKKRIDVQVAVLGAGAGGVTAAVAAARQGAKVLLVDRQGFVGGNLVTGLPLLGFLDMHGRQVIGGIAQEIVDRLVAMEGCYGHRSCPFHNSVTVVNPMYTRIICFELLKESGVELLLHCEAARVQVNDGRLETVTVVGKGQEIEIHADVFIDATGDGDIAFMAGAAYEKGQKVSGALQSPSLLFDLGGVNLEHFFDYLAAHPEELPYSPEMPHIRPGYDAAFLRASPNHVFFGLNALVRRLRDEGKCPIDRDTIIYINQPMPGHVVINSIRMLNFDGSDVFDLSRGERDSHLQIMPLIRTLQENVPGFENCYLSSINPMIGVRETRRIVGKTMLREDSVLRADIPVDTVALGSFMLDIHSGVDDSTSIRALEKPYGIPHGCLVPADITGLMMSGRCISVDAVVFGSIRVMPTCMAIGEAAGVSAATAAAAGIDPADIDVAHVRSVLLAQGAILA